jgi:peptidoglycan hydrolase CwlO-like protein
MSFFFVFIGAGGVRAQTQGEIDARIKELEAKIAESQKKSNTLQNTITQLDDGIKLTIFKIDSRKSNIAKLSLEIDELNSEIDRLDVSLKTIIERTRARIPFIYKERVVPRFGLWFLSDTFRTTLLKLQYYKRIDEENSLVLKQLFETQRNFSERKNLREVKKQQQVVLRTQLESEMASLDRQKKEKQVLLDITKNSEKNYQALLTQARAQAAAFSGFANASGGSGILSGQTVCNDWGCYYNQRDGQWGNQQMGGSPESVREVGCLITSVAMVATHYKRDLKPSDIAAEYSAFFARTAYLLYPITVKGISITRTSIGANTGNIDRELSAGRPVIVGLYNGYGQHFVVIKSGSAGNYIMNDPYVENGHDIPFTSQYRVANIFEVNSVSVN